MNASERVHLTNGVRCPVSPKSRRSGRASVSGRPPARRRWRGPRRRATARRGMGTPCRRSWTAAGQPMTMSGVVGHRELLDRLLPITVWCSSTWFSTSRARNCVGVLAALHASLMAMPSCLGVRCSPARAGRPRSLLGWRRRSPPHLHHACGRLWSNRLDHEHPHVQPNSGRIGERGAHWPRRFPWSAALCRRRGCRTLPTACSACAAEALTLRI